MSVIKTKTKTKVIQANHNKGLHFPQPMKTQSETRNLFEAREDTSAQVAVVFSFESDWLRGWRRFSGPITEQS